MSARLSRSGLCAALVVALVAATAACGGTPAPADSSGPASSSFDEQLSLAEADDRVTDSQLAALREAADSGEMSYEEISALLEETFQCFDDAGIGYRRLPDLEPIPGFVMPNYGHDAEPLSVADDCLVRTSQYAYDAYARQPAALELLDAALEAERDEILACLRAKGATIDDDATLDEMRQTDIALFEEAMAAGNRDFDYCSEYYR